MQLYDEVALVRNGQVLHVLSGSGSRGVFPVIDSVAPRAVLAAAPSTVVLTGANLAVPHNAVLARCQGVCHEFGFVVATHEPVFVLR